MNKKLDLADLKKIYKTLNENTKKLPVAIKVSPAYHQRIINSVTTVKAESYYTLGLQVIIDKKLEKDFELVYAEEE